MRNRSGRLMWVVEYRGYNTKNWKAYGHECYPSSTTAREAMNKIQHMNDSAKKSTELREFQITRYTPEVVNDQQ